MPPSASISATAAAPPAATAIAAAATASGADHAAMPHGFFLIPGYGAQGGTGKDVAAFFKSGLCGVVNSSRGLLTAHKGKSEGMDFADYTRAAVLAMKEDIGQWL